MLSRMGQTSTEWRRDIESASARDPAQCPKTSEHAPAFHKSTRKYNTIINLKDIARIVVKPIWEIPPLSNKI